MAVAMCIAASARAGTGTGPLGNERRMRGEPTARARVRIMTTRLTEALALADVADLRPRAERAEERVVRGRVRAQAEERGERGEWARDRERGERARERVEVRDDVPRGRGEERVLVPAGAGGAPAAAGETDAEAGSSGVLFQGAVGVSFVQMRTVLSCTPACRKSSQRRAEKK